ESEITRRVNDESARSFALESGPLFRAKLLRLHDHDHVLLLGMHHIITDAWSRSVLFRELALLYDAFCGRRESPLRELRVQYADYAVWQRERLQDHTLQPHIDYWREQLAGAPELLELPFDRPRPAVQTFRGGREEIRLSREVLRRLRMLA